MSWFVCWFIIDAALCSVQECHPCHPQCRGCTGHSDGLCIECINYKQGARCVESCFSNYFIDGAAKQCIECDRECVQCYGPTAAHCTSCRVLKLYHNLDDRGPDSPVHGHPHFFVSLHIIHQFSKTAFLLACFLPHCWGSEITLCTNSLHCCLSLANHEHSATVLFDQSLKSAVHLRLGLPRLLFPSLLPSSISVHRFLALITWPKYWSLRCCTVVSRCSCGCTSCSTDALVRCAVQLTLSNHWYAVISKRCIHLLSIAFIVHVSHRYLVNWLSCLVCRYQQ